ncbi:MAG: 2-C-methyl-D-erythritol 4-phosphate cytidylyltransferase [Lachnospiraceae bacterium]|nr:2-C-methyl-D-erythritol 4-phosphate cytidylyltransferase [Lachnospiraceae bacterium]
MNHAILLSGGRGTRAGSDIPKQYIEVRGRMMITYSLKTLLECERIDAIYIVAEEAWRERISEEAEATAVCGNKIKAFVTPGPTRQMSIFNGIKEIIKDFGDIPETDTVLIHDAARPFLTLRLLKACYEALPGHEGVMPVLRMKDTVYKSQDGRTVSALLKREEIFAGQAPELFLLKPYLRANEELMPEKILSVNGASEPAVMAGMDIAMIPGDEGNFKVTTDADLSRFKEITEA